MDLRYLFPSLTKVPLYWLLGILIVFRNTRGKSLWREWVCKREGVETVRKQGGSRVGWMGYYPPYRNTSNLHEENRKELRNIKERKERENEIYEGE